MASKVYIRILDADNRVRNSFETRKGKIIRFTVQYEVSIEGRWRPVVRYDTAHGFAHKDLIHADGKKEKMALGSMNFNEALAYAQNDINLNWPTYYERYFKELQK